LTVFRRMEPDNGSGDLPPTDLHRHRVRSMILFFVSVILSAAGISFLFNIEKEPPNAERFSMVGDFPEQHVWFNTTVPLSLYTQLQGHVLVVLFCDFTSLADVPDLERLQQMRDGYLDSPVQFVTVYITSDSSLTNWRERVQSWGIDFPVIVDDDGAVKRSFGVTASPEVVVLDTHSRIVSHYHADWVQADISGVIDDLLMEGVASNSLAFNPFVAEPGEYIPEGYAGGDPGR
jgi:hypothetical protein